MISLRPAQEHSGWLPEAAGLTYDNPGNSCQQFCDGIRLQHLDLLALNNAYKRQRCIHGLSGPRRSNHNGVGLRPCRK